MEPQWDPEWKSQIILGQQHWEARMGIPFAELGETPELEDSWQIRLRRTNGGRVNRASSVFPETMPAMLFFNQSAATGRQLLYWSGAPDREERRYSAWEQNFMRAGWDMHICSTQKTLTAAHPIADAFWFRHPNGQVKVPDDYWSSLIPAVSNGAVAAFISYWGIPLDRYFNDSSFKVSSIEIKGVPLSGRKTTHISPGEWGMKPYNISNALGQGYSPCYGFIPADPSAWTVLAIGNNGDGRAPFPYLLVRRYGRGLVVLGGDAIPASAPEILENMLQWNTRMRQEIPDGELKLD